MGGLWHDVEALCPTCQTWQRTGATTTTANLASRDPHALGGKVLLPCGHRIDLQGHQLRLGSVVAR